MPVTGRQGLGPESVQRPAQAVDVSWGGTISRNTKFYLAATLADHRQLDKFTYTHGKFYCMLSNIGNMM